MRSDMYTNPNDVIKKLCPFSTNMEELPAGGVPTYRVSQETYISTEEANTMVIGTSGSGKTRGCTTEAVISMLMAKESVLLVDPKGEIYPYLEGYLTGYQQYHLNFRNFQKSDTYNPLTSIRRLYNKNDPDSEKLAAEEIQNLANSIYNAPNTDNPFWTNAAKSVFVGLIRALIECAPAPEMVNIASISNMVSTGKERVQGSFDNVLKSFFTMLGTDSLAYMDAAVMINTASDTRAGIESSLLEPLKLFTQSTAVLDLFSHDGIDISLLDEKPTFISITLPEENIIYHELAGIFITQVYNHYIQLAQSLPQQRLSRRFNFVLEEFGNISKAIPIAPTMLSACRSRNIRMMIVLQCLSQLEENFSKGEVDTITSNCELSICFRTSHFQTLKMFSELCGERVIMLEDNKNIIREPLITPAQLLQLKQRQALVLYHDMKFITKFPDISEYPPVKTNGSRKRHKNRKIEKPLIFNVVEYVNERKKVTKPDSHNQRNRPQDSPF